MLQLKPRLQRIEQGANKWAALHGAPHITRQGWAILASVVLSLAGLLALGSWVTWLYGWSLAATMLNREENFGPLAIVLIRIVLFSFNVGAACMYFLGRYKRRGKLTFPFAKFFGIYLAYLAGVQIIGYVLLGIPFPTFLIRHPLYFGVLVRTAAVMLLTSFAIFIYFFKEQSKFLYGLSEVVIAVLSNLALIGRIDFSKMPHVIGSGTDVIALCAFTYLLSRGVSNMMEGAASYKLRFEKLLKDGRPSVVALPDPDVDTADTSF